MTPQPCTGRGGCGGQFSRINSQVCSEQEEPEKLKPGPFYQRTEGEHGPAGGEQWFQGHENIWNDGEN